MSCGMANVNNDIFILMAYIYKSKQPMFAERNVELLDFVGKQKPIGDWLRRSEFVPKKSEKKREQAAESPSGCCCECAKSKLKRMEENGDNGMPEHLEYVTETKLKLRVRSRRRINVYNGRAPFYRCSFYYICFSFSFHFANFFSFR